MAIFLLLIIVAAVALIFVQQGNAASLGDNVSGTCGAITNDPSTWPTGDSVWDVCRAIAVAEGANIHGSNPDRLNNPGDISDGAGQFGFENHSGSAVTKFPDKQTGWNWLHDKIQHAFVDGTSQVYNADMTWTQFAQKYAGDWQNWLDNVTLQLGIDSESRVGDYFGT